MNACPTVCLILSTMSRRSFPYHKIFVVLRQVAALYWSAHPARTEHKYIRSARVLFPDTKMEGRQYIATTLRTVQRGVKSTQMFVVPNISTNNLKIFFSVSFFCFSIFLVLSFILCINPTPMVTHKVTRNHSS